ncbi:hypothetical protein ASZ90_019908 [hydrocarbon metagenome]|uniref:Purine nucleoside phosphorylase n=1 Tax=hydrocarbon metagenome TaxID=938273 RepID=A0A0W8E256_9ZZZZ
MDKWIWDKYLGMEYITIPHWLEQGIDIGFSTRHSGASLHPFHSLNMGLHVGDDPVSVIRNRQEFTNIFGIGLNRVVCCEQVHGSSVAYIDGELAGRGAEDYYTSLPAIDAMVTNTPGVMLAAFYADCIPVFFLDPLKRAVAIAHSGWKGTRDRIVANTLQTMVEQFGSDIVDIEVFLGPGIGRCCFQIQPDLAEKVSKVFPGFDGIMYRNREIFWDLRLTNRNILIEAGIKPMKIIDCGICTSCRTDSFYSHRREKGKTGRMMAAIGLRIPR